jgi:hypothetical protein
MKSPVLWDITSRSPLKVSQHFGGICRLHLQGRRINQARNHHETGSRAGFLFGILLEPEYGGDMFFFSSKRRLTFNGLHGIIPLILLVTTTVGTSNPTVRWSDRVSTRKVYTVLTDACLELLLRISDCLQPFLINVFVVFFLSL